MQALVTTSASGDDAEARELATRFGLAFEPRRDRLVEDLLAHTEGAPVLILGSLSADLFTRSEDGRILSQRASLGMALLRFSRALEGQLDTIVRAANLVEGDRVIDATLGLGADALIAAQRTRRTVLAFEKSPLLAAFTQAALRRPGGDAALRKAAVEAGERIEIQSGDHLDLLRARPDQSAEVVLFDPMFRSAVESQPVFDVIRAHADHAPLSREAIEQARRTARRGILVKDSPRGAELKRLGILPVYARRFLLGWIGAIAGHEIKGLTAVGDCARRRVVGWRRWVIARGEG